MLEERGGLGLTRKVCDEVLVGGEVRREDFDCDSAVKRDLRRFVHDAHTAFADRSLNYVARYLEFAHGGKWAETVGAALSISRSTDTTRIFYHDSIDSCFCLVGCNSLKAVRFAARPRS